MAERLYVRKFLNKARHHAGAHIIASVEDTSRSTLRNPWCSTMLEISDCSRVVNLEFPLTNKAHQRNSMHKINLLIDVLERFRDAMQAEIDLSDERKARHDGDSDD